MTKAPPYPTMSETLSKEPSKKPASSSFPRMVGGQGCGWQSGPADRRYSRFFNLYLRRRYWPL